MPIAHSLSKFKLTVYRDCMHACLPSKHITKNNILVKNLTPTKAYNKINKSQMKIVPQSSSR